MGVPHSLAPVISDSESIVDPSPTTRDRPCLRTSLGRAYDDVMALKRSCAEEREHNRLLKLNSIPHGGATDVNVNGDVLHADALYGGVPDLSLSIDDIESLSSFLDSSSFPNSVDTDSLLDIETNFLSSSFPLFESLALKAFFPPFSHPFDLTKPPSSYTEALA